MAGFSQFDAVFNVLILVVAITWVTRRLRFPYTVALIIAGLLSAAFPRFPLPELSPNIFVSILLPPILFEAALSLNVDGLIEDADIVFSYAAVGTLLTVGVVAGFAYLLLGFGTVESLMLGIIIAPTDPVAVIATLKHAGVRKRFQLIVEGEALFNDGVAIVAYSILVAIVTLGSITPFQIISIAVISVVGGVSLGIAGGYFAHFLITLTDDKFAEVLIGFLLSFGIYRIAEGFQASGVIAVVIAGLIMNYRTKHYGGLTPESVQQMSVFWEFVGFIATSLAFIFIGIYLNPQLLVSYSLLVAALTIFIFVTRYAKVTGLAMILKDLRNKSIPRNWQMGIWWSGLRGAVSVVLVLGVASLKFPHEEEMRALTYGVVLATNIIWGITIPYAIKRYRLIQPEKSAEPMIPDSLFDLEGSLKKPTLPVSRPSGEKEDHGEDEEVGAQPIDDKAKAPTDQKVRDDEQRDRDNA